MKDQRQQHFDGIASLISTRLEVPVKITLGVHWGTVSIRFRTIADFERIVSQLERDMDEAGDAD